MREKSLDDMDKAHQIYPDHPVPITRRDEFQRSAATDACIAADDVHLFENSQRFCCGALHRCTVSYVTFDTMRVDPLALKFSHSGVEGAGLNVCQHHPHVRSSKGARQRKPDAAGPAGYECNFSVEFAHCLPHDRTSCQLSHSTVNLLERT